MANKKNILTYEGYRALEEERDELKSKLNRMSSEIKEAREQGDLSENAEYDAAREKQASYNARIMEIGKILKNSEIVVEEEVDASKISIGCYVTIKDLEDGEVNEYKLVGSTEANALKGKISNESPVGSQLIGRAIGDIIDVETQGGVFQYEILDIRKSN